MVGANFWDAPGHSMAGSNDIATRTEIFQWIAKNEKALYLPRSPMHPVGVYFSPKSRDYDVDDFLPSYRGTLLLLLQTHREFQVVTPRTLDEFAGEVLVLPNVSVLNQGEQHALKRLAERGVRIVITGKDASGLGAPSPVVRFETCPAKIYFKELERDFAVGSRNMPKGFLQAMETKSEIDLEAPATIAANIAQVTGTPHIFLVNFGGLVPHRIAVPAPAQRIRVRLPATTGDELAYLPFLGETQILHGVKQGDRVEFTLPPVERGAVVWPAAKN